MIRKCALIGILLAASACGELQGVVNQIPGNTGVVSNADIAEGLRQALNLGIEKQVSQLAKADGFYRNDLVKILLPDELKKVERTMRDIGLGSLADEGLMLMNRAAEDAVKEATPIFVNAVKGITFNDARGILLGNERAATEYLTRTTQSQLYQKFHPVIGNSFEKVGADRVWSTIISRYNALPLTSDVNPDLTDYVTQEALEGVYTMIAVEEKEIRTSIASRSTALLKKVFALQD
jgi:hypothetical protein